MTSGSQNFDVVVIGSGPGGQKAAVQAAKAGRTVLLVERDQEVGGACVHRGTIPSKTFRELAVRWRNHVRMSRDLGVDPGEDVLQGQSILSRMRPTLASHVGYMEDQIARNGIEQWRGVASFLDPHRIEVLSASGQRRIAEAEYVVIATGSRPRNPREMHVDHQNVLDSDSILSLSWMPETLVVLGAGVIGSEYASIFQAFGVKVTLVDSADRPLRFLDESMSEEFRQAFEDDGGTFIGGARASEVAWDGVGEVRTSLTNGEALVSQKVMIAAGRVSNIEQLDIAKAGLEASSRGLIDVDEDYRTGVSHIFAVGDVIGPPALASSSMEQGRHAVCAALGLPVGCKPEFVPSGIYTLPELAAVGLTESQAREEHGDVLIGTAKFAELSRGRISTDGRGTLKLVASPDGSRIHGVHVIGEGAAELVHLGQMAMLSELGIETFVKNVFNFPTLAEAYRVAALHALKQRSAAPVGG